MKIVQRIGSILLILSILPAVIPASAASAAGADLPEKYDSRDYGYITSVKNQGGYGTCWAHATLAACEASLIKNNGFSDDTDLSELHLAYCATHQMYDRLGMFDSEVTVPIEYTFMNDGYYIDLAAVTLANLNGAVLDSTHYSQFSSDRFEMFGLNAMNIPDHSLQYGINTARLTGYYVIPMEETQKVKEYLMRCGACAFSMFVDNRYEGDGDHPSVFFNPPDSNGLESPHAMCIVGWDDTIPADKLSVDGGQPEHDGAYIVKNSWGIDSGDDGYYYVPYEEQTIKNSSAIFFEFESEDTYTYCYAYDDLQNDYLLKSEDPSETVKGANIFTASFDDESLKAVSFFAQDEHFDYQIDIYTDVTDSPESGELRTTTSGSVDYGGYRTVALSEPIPLKAGQKFSVVLTLNAEDGTAVICDSPIGSDGAKIVKHRNYGESFYYTQSRGWRDLLDVEETKDDEEMGGTQNAGNIRIKAFTDSPSAKPYAEPDDYLFYDGKTKEAWVASLSSSLEKAQAVNVDLSFNYSPIYNKPLHAAILLSKQMQMQPDVFTAAEIADMNGRLSEETATLPYRDYAEIFCPYDTDFTTSCYERILEMREDPYISALPVYREFAEKGERFNEMARNLELTSDNYFAVSDEIIDSFFELQRYLYETGSYGSVTANYGDADNDGKVTILDVTCIQKTLASLRKEDYFSRINSDINNDNVSDIIDAVYIQKLLASVIGHLPVYDENWDVEDGYTAKTDRKTLKAYLAQAIETGRQFENLEPNIFTMQDLTEFIQATAYDKAKEILSDPDRYSSGEILYFARTLVYFSDI